MTSQANKDLSRLSESKRETSMSPTAKLSGTSSKIMMKSSAKCSSPTVRSRIKPTNENQKPKRRFSPINLTKKDNYPVQKKTKKCKICRYPKRS